MNDENNAESESEDNNCKSEPYVLGDGNKICFISKSLASIGLNLFYNRENIIIESSYDVEEGVWINVDFCFWRCSDVIRSLILLLIAMILVSYIKIFNFEN